MIKVKIPASKSQAHRLLICSALSERPVTISCDGMSEDIMATINCLRSLGTDIEIDESDRAAEIRIKPISRISHGEVDSVDSTNPDSITATQQTFESEVDEVELECGESGSTLRFLIPICGILGQKARFNMQGRLPQRPLAPFDEELRKHGMIIRQEGNLLHVEGRLHAGTYVLPGNISSQYISALLMTLPLLEGDSSLCIRDNMESLDYITMTEKVLSLAGCRLNKSLDGHESTYETEYTEKFIIHGGQKLEMPRSIEVEGDWSNGAFFLSLGALMDEGLEVCGLSQNTGQGDKRILGLLEDFGAQINVEADKVIVRRGELKGQIIDCSMIPDLIPVLAVVASVADGRTEFINAGRLRFKESDRIESTVNMICSLEGKAYEDQDGITVDGCPRLKGGVVNSYSDHRIAMAAGVAKVLCEEKVVISNPECVNKSYPRFWEDLGAALGGQTQMW
ncbi:MAG: 3-phosphoshikimate 1-carboxyvinyltransferase [Bacillota bacterium]|nr:3-phosphoshikimate 1-carboxyvinyltransferase [Bacillota bacterium]